MAKNTKRLPTFLIVGAAKSGTSSLYNYLRSHPNIFMPHTIKESYFLCNLPRHEYSGLRRRFQVPVTDWEGYQALFADATDQHFAIGEACPAYLYYYDRTIPEILCRLGAETKIIMILRDPVERAFSGYMHAVRDGTEPLTFEDALAMEASRIKEGWWWGYHYRQIGHYFEQVRAYMATFPRSQTLLLHYADLERNPGRCYQDILHFLEVDETFIPDMSLRYNSTGIPRSKFLHRFLLESNYVKRVVAPLLPKEARHQFRHRLINFNLRPKPTISAHTKETLYKEFQTDITLLQQATGLDIRSLS